MNGLAEFERHELRASSAYGFYDDPSRLLRLVRFRVRLGFTVEERTQMQVANARDAGVEKTIPPRPWRRNSNTSAPKTTPPTFAGVGEAGLLTLSSPVLAVPNQPARHHQV